MSLYSGFGGDEFADCTERSAESHGARRHCCPDSAFVSQHELHIGRQKEEREIAIMAYVITDTCTKDELCVEACPTDCIHPKKDEDGFEAATQLYVDPEGCIDCGACVPVCPTNSIFIVDEVPADKQEFIAKNAEHYANA
jgi:ferredoxin